MSRKPDPRYRLFNSQISLAKEYIVKAEKILNSEKMEIGSTVQLTGVMEKLDLMSDHINDALTRRRKWRGGVLSKESRERCEDIPTELKEMSSEEAEDLVGHVFRW